MDPRLTYEQSEAVNLYIFFLKTPSNPPSFVPVYLHLLQNTCKVIVFFNAAAQGRSGTERKEEIIFKLLCKY